MVDRPLPTPDQDSMPYWDAAKRQELALQLCGACERYQFYARLICVECGSGDISWRAVSGEGVVYSYTVNHRAPGAWAADRVPYIVALIDLAEGPRMVANIVDSDHSAVRIGAPVRVVFEEVSETISLPQFTILQSTPTDV